MGLVFVGHSSPVLSPSAVAVTQIPGAHPNAKFTHKASSDPKVGITGAVQKLNPREVLGHLFLLTPRISICPAWLPIGQDPSSPPLA